MRQAKDWTWSSARFRDDYGRLLPRSADFNRLTPLEHPHDTIKSETPNPTQPNPTQPITDHGHSSSGSDRTVSAIARFKPTKVG
ncbi:MAG: hypothetical protein WCT12_33210, partial [Verrucomicrobiota bacterium]